MKLHWSPRSPFVRKVMIAAHELGVAGQITTVRTLVQMDKPNPVLLQDNPLGKIPTLVLEDGTVLYDSLTICEYLDVRAGPRLFPAAGRARWEALTLHALGQGFMDALILWRNERDKPSERQTPALVQAFATKTQVTLDHLESVALTLEDTPFGIGHIAVGCALSYLDFRFDALGWRTGHDQLAAWHATFEARPSVLATAVVDA